MFKILEDLDFMTRLCAIVKISITNKIILLFERLPVEADDGELEKIPFPVKMVARVDHTA